MPIRVKEIAHTSSDHWTYAHTVVPYVRTSDNLADFFTKPMKSASQFHTLRKHIMNEA